MQNQTKYLLILISQISSKQSKLLAEQSFDAWGRYRNPETWQYESESAAQSRTLTASLLNGRGYTAHEMLPTFALINMNGRLYDPVLGRMLSPDNYIQLPDYTQNFNRYAYVLNNPLKYRDPSGEFVFAMIFLANVIADATDGGSFSLIGDFKHTGYILNQVNDASQITVYENNNVKITAGYDVYSGGMSANFNFQSGNFSGNVSAGIGISGWYVNGGISYSPGDLNISIDGGIGSNYKAWGVNATYKGWGLGYHKTYYGNEVIYNDPVYGPQKSKQNVGGIDMFFNYNSLTIENDYFAFENDGMGNRYDRWRSNAIEYRGQNGLIVGTHLFNNDPEGDSNNGTVVSRDKNGESRLWGKNKGSYGAWKHGVTYSSPFYVGYRYGNHIDKIGWDNGVFQDLTQNFIHKYFLTHQNYYNQYVDDYSRPYFYSGYYNPYSIWGR